MSSTGQGCPIGANLFAALMRQFGADDGRLVAQGGGCEGCQDPANGGMVIEKRLRLGGLVGHRRRHREGAENWKKTCLVGSGIMEITRSSGV